MQVLVTALMTQSGVKFGTSGARGLAVQMTDRVCYIYTCAFLQHLEVLGDIKRGGRVAVAGDFRPSTPRIMAACAKAIADAGYLPDYCGFIPTPAVAFYAISNHMASLMVTGSHIPDDRNGIKFNKPTGEILKEDEQGIAGQQVFVDEGLFDAEGMLLGPFSLGAVNRDAEARYVDRYARFFGSDALRGKTIAVYQHSSVARDVLPAIFGALGAEIIYLGRSEIFVPVDTEAIRPEDVALAKQWAKEHRFDCIVSADGDGDRPLIGDEKGNWLRGDVAGILCARYLEAQSVATPVSSNSALEKCGWFQQVMRTRIGSPHVIAAMAQALSEHERVVGYEANGGFLIASDIMLDNRTLLALPTRDAAIVPLAILMLAKRESCAVSELLSLLPNRYTYSERIKDFPAELSARHLAEFNTGNIARDKAEIERAFAEPGAVKSIDATDGVRITFDSAEVIHLRPSGNAPELRCYTEADTEQRAVDLNRYCITIMQGWKL